LNVQVRLYGLLRRHHPGPNASAPLTLELAEGATAADAAARLNLPDGLIHAASLNGVACELDQPLRDGDRVGLFPPAAGGYA
jgi:molybdopterin converting factor small subunit